jgi:hypothetical protein
MSQFLIVSASTGLTLAVMLQLEPALGAKYSIVLNATELKLFLVGGIAHI